MIKNPNINDFKIEETDECKYIEWKEIERILGKVKYKKFNKWIGGQTCLKQGAYVCDVINFLKPANKRFFD
jgi:hypothetical protein